VPSPPSHTAVGGQASLLPKRKPLTEEEIEAIMVCLLFTEAEYECNAMFVLSIWFIELIHFV
jgi:hypothetical protein